jgi:hypothetical protein
VVIVLAIGHKVRGFKPDEVDGFFRAIKIRSTTSFGGEVKPSVTCRKIFRHVKKKLTGMEQRVRTQSLSVISSPRFSCFAIRCL